MAKIVDAKVAIIKSVGPDETEKCKRTTTLEILTFVTELPAG